jgi:hypothetical protein
MGMVWATGRAHTTMRPGSCDVSHFIYEICRVYYCAQEREKTIWDMSRVQTQSAKLEVSDVVRVCKYGVQWRMVGLLSPTRTTVRK